MQRFFNLAAGDGELDPVFVEALVEVAFARQALVEFVENVLIVLLVPGGDDGVVEDLGLFVERHLRAGQQIDLSTDGAQLFVEEVVPELLDAVEGVAADLGQSGDEGVGLGAQARCREGVLGVEG